MQYSTETAGLHRNREKPGKLLLQAFAAHIMHDECRCACMRNKEFRATRSLAQPCGLQGTQLALSALNGHSRISSLQYNSNSSLSLPGVLKQVGKVQTTAETMQRQFTPTPNWSFWGSEAPSLHSCLARSGGGYGSRSDRLILSCYMLCLCTSVKYATSDIMLALPAFPCIIGTSYADSAL